MSTRARKITELPASTTLSSNDVFVVEKVSNSSISTTSKMTATSLRKLIVQGPYANDSVANTGGIVVGEPYYTADGIVRIRIT
jgi:hypothetical protein